MTGEHLSGIVVLTAPSGAGKSTIAARLFQEIPRLRFSVSATTREPRSYEVDGAHYHFMTDNEFKARVERGEFIEYEEVYPGKFYGTLFSEIESATPESPVLLDIDVRGALRVKERFGDKAFVVFIAPPSEKVLLSRLRARGTETSADLDRRIDRIRYELGYRDRFDAVIVNDSLDTAVEEAGRLVRAFLEPERPKTTREL